MWQEYNSCHNYPKQNCHNYLLNNNHDYPVHNGYNRPLDKGYNNPMDDWQNGYLASQTCPSLPLISDTLVRLCRNECL